MKPISHSVHLSNLHLFCSICGDRLPHHHRSQNCTPCSTWSRRLFHLLAPPTSPLDSAYDWIRRLGGQVFTFER